MPGTIYDIPLSKNFLLETAKTITCLWKNFDSCRIFLPNRRSCRVFMHHFSAAIGVREMARPPRVSALGDNMEFDGEKATYLMAHLLRKNMKNEHISINNLFQLAGSITALLKEIVMSDLEWNRWEAMLPQRLRNYREQAFGILSECLRSDEIKDIVGEFRIRKNLFLKSLSAGRIAAVGICPSNRYASLFLQKVAQSDDALLFISDDGKRESRNYQINNELYELLELKRPAVIRLPSKQRYFEEFIGAYGAQDRSVHVVHEDPSTEATQKLPKERMFRMKSIGAVEGEASVPGIVESAEFPSPALEALGVAIAAKEAMDDGKSVLIVCSESKLSEKITMELRRWSIVPDDSLGIPFSKTADGVAVSLTVDMIKGDFKLSDGLNALKVGGLYADTLVPFELFCRKLRFPQENFFAAAALYGEEKLPFIKKITDICAAKFHAGSLQQWLDYCREFLQIINPSSCDGLVEVAKKFSEASHLCGDMDVAEFATFLKNQILAIRIRSATGHSEGIVLVGIIEAQLLDADLVIIAGTTEENLTASDTNDFWMNKSTLESFGVRSDDAKNIFVQSVFERLVHKSRVLITRSRLVSGSRAPKYSYLDKIETTLSVTRATRLEKLVAETWDFVTPEPLKFSPPVPALEDRPSKFSASDINLLLNDAYGFYAKKILRLEELNHPGATRNLRGNYLHEILEILIKKPKSQRNPGTICQIAVEILQKWRVDTVLFGLWFFRLKNIASFVMAHLDEADISRAELSGGCRMLTDSGYPFELFCRADRIDIHPDQSVSIIDYKTTSAQKQARYGYTPQLLVEAIIARNNGFGLGTTDLRNLCIWQLTGSPGSTAIVQISDSREKTLKLLEEASAGLGKLIEQYNGRGIPYDINVGYRQSKIYHRLARAREWGERRS